MKREEELLFNWLVEVAKGACPLSVIIYWYSEMCLGRVSGHFPVQQSYCLKLTHEERFNLLTRFMNWQIDRERERRHETLFRI